MLSEHVQDAKVSAQTHKNARTQTAVFIKRHPEMASFGDVSYNRQKI